MALDVTTGLAWTGSNADATSYETAEITPVSGAVYLAVIASTETTTAGLPSCTGTNGLSVTWTVDGAKQTVGNGQGLTVFRGVAFSAVAGTLTFDFGASTQTGAAWGVFRVVEGNTTDVILQPTTGGQTNDDTPTVTLPGALGSANNGIAMFVSAKTQTLTLAADAGWTELSAEYYHTSSNLTIGGCWALGGADLSPSMTLSAAANWITIGVELVAVAAASPTLVSRHHPRGTMRGTMRGSS